MNFSDIVSLALRNLRQAKLRTVLTAIGVVVGVAAIITMVSFGIQPVASLVLGYSAQHFGPSIAIRLNGLLLMACALTLLTARPALRHWEFVQPRV